MARRLSNDREAGSSISPGADGAILEAEAERLLKDVREALMVARDSSGKLVRRPLSPHIQVYRWPISMALSITHRITGVGLGLGMLLLTGWLFTAATSEGGFERFQSFLGSAFGMFLLFCWTLALVFHLMTGLRHLWMDTGSGYDEKTYHYSAVAVLAATAGLTALIWVAGVMLW
jgi:succinate dehydrogenase / fumarate reductase cytochrome b subunit